MLHTVFGTGQSLLRCASYGNGQLSLVLKQVESILYLYVILHCHLTHTATSHTHTHCHLNHTHPHTHTHTATSHTHCHLTHTATAHTHTHTATSHTHCHLTKLFYCPLSNVPQGDRPAGLKQVGLQARAIEFAATSTHTYAHAQDGLIGAYVSVIACTNMYVHT
jgi:hypothetical protein